MTIIDFPELREIEGRIDGLHATLKTVFEEAGPAKDFTQVKALGDGDTTAKVAELGKINSELADLMKAHKDKVVILKAAELAGDDYEQFASLERVGTKARQTLGERWAKSAARLQTGAKQSFDDVDVKTLMTRAAGWAPESLREPGYVPAASAPIMLADIIPFVTTGQAAVKYMEQTTRTNNAAERAEGATYGEAAIVLTERSVTVESIGVWIPVTDEQVEDEPEAESLINLDLPLMLRQRVDLQQLVGDGSTPNIRGVNNVAGIQTQAKGADAVMDAIYKGRTKVRVTGRAMPNGLVIHPNDWQDIRLTRTADGIYILGNPDSVGPISLWGLQVAESDNQTENTAVVGDFLNYARFYVRRGIEIERTNSHNTDFINGRQAIRATMRGAMVWKRPAAFCTVTGI
jgi:HK97 family phage major capsid protein